MGHVNSGQDSTGKERDIVNRHSKVALVTAALISMGGSAYAVPWGELRSSLGYGKGNFFDYGEIYARNDDQQKKVDSGTDGIYISTYTDFYNRGQYVDSDHKTSHRTTSHSYVSG